MSLPATERSSPVAAEFAEHGWSSAPRVPLGLSRIWWGWGAARAGNPQPGPVEGDPRPAVAGDEDHRRAGDPEVVAAQELRPPGDPADRAVVRRGAVAAAAVLDADRR